MGWTIGNEFSTYGEIRKMSNRNCQIVLSALYALCLFGARSAVGQTREHRPCSVMPKEAATQVTRLCSRGGVSRVDGGWMPSTAIVDRIENKIQRVASLKSKDGIVGSSISD